MVQFFQNLWVWVSEHAGVIAAVVSVACVVLTAVCTVLLLLERRAVREQQATTTELSGAVTTVNAASDKAKALDTRVEALSSSVGDIMDAVEQCVTKLNCVLDVQQEAYSVSLAKTKTLDAINGIIANGKYAETRARKAISEEVAELRAAMEKLTEVSKASEEKVKKITGISVVDESGVKYD